MFLFCFTMYCYFTVHCTVILLYIYCSIAVQYTVLLLYILILFWCTLYCYVAVHLTVKLLYIVLFYCSTLFFFYCLQLHYCTIVHWTRKINCNEYFIIFRSQRWFNMKVWFHIFLTIVIKNWTNWRTCN